MGENNIFRNLCYRIAKAETNEELSRILFIGDECADMAYIRDKITYLEHEILYGLVDAHRANTEQVTMQISIDI